MRRKSTLLLSCLFALLLSASAQNQAISLNGTDNYVTTTGFPVPSSGDFTVEFWANVPSPLLTTGNGLHEFVSQGTGGGTGFYIGYDQNNGNIRCGDNFISTFTPMPVDQWVHIALVNSGGTATLYVNGVLKQTQTGYSIGAGGNPFTIGQQFPPFNAEFMKGLMDEVRVWTVARTVLEIKQGMFAGVNAADPTLAAYYKMDQTSGNSVPNSSATAGLDGTLQGASSTWVPSPIQVGNNALNLDGVNDEVSAPGNAAYDLTTGTVECLINPTVLNTDNSCIIGNRGPSSTRYSFHVSATQLGMWNGTTFATINYAVPAGTATWTHLAFVCDGTNTTAYVNGVSVGTFGQAFGTSSTLAPLAFGVTKNGIEGEFFNGSIDEVRIWNTQRTAGDILANMNSTLTGAEPGLVALFSFDQGIAGGDNTQLITTIDNTVATNNATLSNLSLSTGSVSNIIASPLIPVILPVNFLSFDAIQKDGQAYLQWRTAQEENSAEFIIERSGNGITYTSIGSVPAAGNSRVPLSYSFTDPSPLKGLNYYRLKEKDLDGKFMYSGVKTLTFSAVAATKLVWFPTGARSVEIDLLPGNDELFTITDLGGRSLQKGRLSNGKLFLSGMASGTYIVHIITAEGKQMNTKVLLP